jgi:S-adenosylmethionine:tRNA ribosyltransferase-isomerase
MATDRVNLPSDLQPFSMADLDYDLPEELIAQRPAQRREDARLLELDRSDGHLVDRSIQDLPGLLGEGDLLVLNDTKVLPAKFHAVRQSGGRIEGLFLEEAGTKEWRVLLRGSKRLRWGERLQITRYGEERLGLTLNESQGDGRWLVRVDSDRTPESILSEFGETPLPPYIKRSDAESSADKTDRDRYQTVYARLPGSVAAPTAGLHFTNELLDKLHANGVETTTLTLHVGVGTFKPIKAEAIDEHNMHEERLEVSSEACAAVARCRQRKGRVIAVGTTSVRTLEASRCDEPLSRCIKPSRATTDIFLYPGRSLHVVDGMITNFHLPRSTLLALVMAFAGIEKTKHAYQHAIASNYRFYSYGDAMLIQ